MMERIGHLKGEAVCPLQLIAGADFHLCEEFCQGLMDGMLADIEAKSIQQLIFKGMETAKEPQLTPVQHMGATLRKFVETNGFHQAKEFVSGRNNEFHHTFHVTRYESDFQVQWGIDAMKATVN